jgi:uncharacterized membrane protein
MPCDPEELRHVPLFELLDEDELQVLAAQVEIKRFAPRQFIFRAGEPGGTGYLMMSGKVRVYATDEDQQEVLVDEPEHGDFFGFASMLQQTDHLTTAMAVGESECVAIDLNDITELLQHRPLAGLDMLTMQARHFHVVEKLVQSRANRNPNEVIEATTTFGERVADAVARFGGSWAFIIAFAVTLSAYTCINTLLRHSAWDPYPFILLNLFLSMLAAVQAPVIMMSQNRQDAKDRLRGELDYEVNKRAAAEIRSLAEKLSLVTDKIEDVDRFLRKTSPIA